MREYLLKQGRFAHFTEEDIAYFQSKVDEMWEEWLVPGVIPLRKQGASEGAPSKATGLQLDIVVPDP